MSSPDGSMRSNGPIAGSTASGGAVRSSGTRSRQCAPSKVRFDRFFTESATQVDVPAEMVAGVNVRKTASRGGRSETKSAAITGIAIATNASSRMSRRSNQSDTATSTAPTTTSAPPRLVSRGQEATRAKLRRFMISSFERCRPEPASLLRCVARWRR